MNIKEKVFLPAMGFFTKEQKATKTALHKLDSAEIFIALLPSAIFGCLIFGLPALLNLTVSIALSVGLDFLWEMILNKRKKLNFNTAVFGLLAGLTLSSRLNILLVIFVNAVAFILRKTVFKNKPMQPFVPWLLARAFFEAVFFKGFSIYAAPFMNATNGTVPIDGMIQLSDYTYPAKYLFFGVQSGNIGETSVLLLGVGGIYLIFRRIINPVIPISFIVTSAILSLVFGESLSLSLLGGGIFLAAFFVALDYSFVSSPLYKKLSYGIVCGVLTFVLRLVFKTESVYLAVIIADCIFFCFTRRNIKALIQFIKNPNWRGLLNKFKKAFSV